MKTLIAAATLIFASTLTTSVAFAYPAVNDSASYEGTYVQDGETYPVTLATTLKAYNAETAQYLQSDVQTVAGQTQSQESWMDEGDLLSPAQVQYLITNCVKRGGALEAITSIAGTFNSCKLTQVSSDGTQTYWFADVPFGIAQFLTTGTSDAGTPYQIAITLQSFANGK